ncbi:NfeD family protein, partial [Reichenbachiella sp.]
LVMLNNDYFDFSFVPTGNLTTAVLVTFLGLIGSFIVMFIGGVRLTESGLFKRIALETTLDKSAGYTSNFKKETLMGKTGVAFTILRPSGKVEIDHEIYDAYTRGSYIEQGAKIEVIGEEGTSLKVKELA